MTYGSVSVSLHHIPTISTLTSDNIIVSFINTTWIILIPLSLIYHLPHYLTTLPVASNENDYVILSQTKLSSCWKCQWTFLFLKPSSLVKKKKNDYTITYCIIYINLTQPIQIIHFFYISNKKRLLYYVQTMFNFFCLMLLCFLTLF